MNLISGRISLSLILFSALCIIISGNGTLHGIGNGHKFFKNYDVDECGLQPQNFCITQGANGIIYAANTGGLLEYDGSKWTAYDIPNRIVRSITVDDSGVVYIGGINEIGFMAPGTGGKLEYRSLLKYIPENKRNFHNVWRSHTTKNGIFFRTSQYLFHRHAETGKILVALEAQSFPADKFNASFTCTGDYFINQRGTGLMKYKNHSFSLIPGGEIFASVNTILMVAPYGKNTDKLLIGTREKGFFLFDSKEGTLTPFPTEIDDFLKQKRGCFGTSLPLSNGDIAVATLRGGIAIIDQNGKRQCIIDRDSGLPDNNVKYLFEDTEGNLWAALNRGISKIEYASPFTIYDGNHGLYGTVRTVCRHNGRLYAGTSDGLFFKKQDENKFRAVFPDANGCFSLLDVDDSLLAATSTGLFMIRNDTLHSISNDRSYTLTRSRRDPKRVWIGIANSLVSLYFSNEGAGQWRVEQRFQEVNRQIRSIIEDTDGNLFLGAFPSGIFKVEFPNKTNIRDYRVVDYDNISSAVTGHVVVGWAAGHVMFGTNQGLFCFDEKTKRFEPDATLGREFSRGLGQVFQLVEDSRKSIWLHAQGRNYLAIPSTGGNYEIKKKILARIPFSWQINDLYPDPMEPAAWFACYKGLIRFDQAERKAIKCEYSTIIRNIAINGTPVFHNPGTHQTEKNFTTGHTVLTYGQRNLRFRFAAPFFEDETAVEFRCSMKGFDKENPAWEKATYKDYTNLSPGKYLFIVQARNIYGALGRESRFAFRILPPWYRTWWAYSLYILLFTLFISSLFWIRFRKQEKERRRLEKIIRERTAEVDDKNRQLESQTIQLMEQARKLREQDHTKSRFFAGISHEFRTPLTLILGPLEHILTFDLPEKLKNYFQVMHRNTLRLLRLINRLLDLSRIDSGKMKLKILPLDIVSLLKAVLASFEGKAGENKLSIDFQCEVEEITLYGEKEKLEDVFENIIGNAVKFTHEGGRITVTVTRRLEKEEDFPEGVLEVMVHDTGCGIPMKQLTHIFDRFFQVGAEKQKNKGTGIGLAWAREIVDLHHGKIDVRSRDGENSWTEFIVRFPLGRAHFKAEDSKPPEEHEERTTEISEPLPNAQIESPKVLAGILGEPSGDTCVLEPRRALGDPPESNKKQIKHTILIVEDNPDMRSFIRDAVEADYTVIEAEDGREGIDKARESMPDLIISDVMMPDVNGYQLCKTLKNDFKTSHIPVILLTAKASEDSFVEGLETGADAYVTKPFSMKILLTRIKSIIEVRRRLQEKNRKEMLLYPEQMEAPSIDDEFKKELYKLISRNYTDPEFNVEALSHKMDISRMTLHRKVIALTGESPTDCIKHYRLRRARQLLEKKAGNITKIAMDTGFSSPAYFTKCFKEMYKYPPSLVPTEVPKT